MKDVLHRYKEESLPTFLGIDLQDVGDRGADGETPLHVASIRGNFDEVTALLDGGADVNSQDDVGYRPLYYAAAYGYGAIAKLLLNHGAMDGVSSEFGTTALEIARENGHQEIVEMISVYR
ncbi:MAG TPA: ankyrin repeat domain-containing protein [Aestuariivirga sp.]|nr:ankyrin repeat domain-containing protein [Alphaproteobacteria bacterium]HRX37225.1 ankyrin repeat domain-containing protein [Aestuariivirga sp.]